MVAEPTTYPGFGREAPIQSIQPGGGWGMRIELAWGRVRRGILRTFFPGYVKRQLTLRQGACPGCPRRGGDCGHEVIDTRDLKYFSTVCGYSFPPESDRFAWRSKIPFARWGLAELVVFTLLSLAASAVVGVLAWFGMNVYVVGLLWLAVLLFWLEIVWFFRDPPRPIPADPAAVVSPADGTIVELAEVPAEGFPDGKAFRVGIFLSVFNVHINRVPLAAAVTRLRYFPGRYLNALKVASARENEQLWIDLEEEGTGMPLRVTQISGALARRIVCELKAGQRVAKGEKFGMIKLGSRTELYLPVGAAFEVAVRVGQKVKGGQSVLLRLRRGG